MSFVNQRLQLVVDDNFLFKLLLQKAKHIRKLHQRIERFLRKLSARAVLDRGINRRHQFKDCGDGIRRIQIIIHRLNEFLPIFIITCEFLLLSLCHIAASGFDQMLQIGFGVS